MRQIQTLLVALGVALIGAAGCGPDVGGPDQLVDGTMHSGPNGSGKILLAWTVGGNAPSMDACTGVDHLVLRLDNDRGAVVEIEPIPCTLTRFRYDNLPVGNSVIRMVGVDVRNCEVTSGATSLRVTDVLPTSPNALSLAAPRACR